MNNETKTPGLRKLQIPAKVMAEIKKRNRLFDESTPAERRVLIAKDVIKQLATKRISATRGVYCEIRSEDRDTLPDGKASFQAVALADRSLSCNVCGIGALLVSATLFKNKKTLQQMESTSKLRIHRTLRGIFSPSQLNLIEGAFEDDASYVNSLEDMEAVNKFNADHIWDSQPERLIAIMENIIANKGTFKP